MRKKNQMAEMALVALNAFLTMRTNDPKQSDRAHLAAVLALEVLKPFTASVEKEIYREYGAGNFPPNVFIDPLKACVVGESKRLNVPMVQQGDMRVLLEAFYAIVEATLEQLSVQLYGEQYESE
ncbi:MAG: hypothetical protein U9Q03_06325 [Patescibacteria group bacterium]|nr:hypothetical protein [Patescibacteria group bacterium]